VRCVNRLDPVAVEDAKPVPCSPYLELRILVLLAPGMRVYELMLLRAFWKRQSARLNPSRRLAAGGESRLLSTVLRAGVGAVGRWEESGFWFYYGSRKKLWYSTTIWYSTTDNPRDCLLLRYTE